MYLYNVKSSLGEGNGHHLVWVLGNPYMDHRPPMEVMVEDVNTMDIIMTPRQWMMDCPSLLPPPDTPNTRHTTSTNHKKVEKFKSMWCKELSS